MSDLQGYTGNLNLIENADDIVVFLTQMRIFQQQINVQVLSNSYLIRQSFLKYRCKSGIVIFAWRVT